MTTILARTTKGKEYLYNRRGAVKIPKSWKAEEVNAVIEGLAKYFKLPAGETFHPYEISDYDLIFPDYEVKKRKGKYALRKLY